MSLLEGIRILDLTRLLPGPWCTLLLSDLGADVIKIEEPGIGDPVRIAPPFIKNISAGHILLNRNKKSLSLNLKKEEGREIFFRLAKDSDVILEGFRPGKVKKLGIDYEEIRKINPQIIYCSISGYGQDGPYKNLPGHDINYVGISGALSLNLDSEGRPVIPGLQIADIGSGALLACVGILSALFSRERTKKGRYIDLSMTDGVFSWLTMYAAIFLSQKRNPKREEMVLQGTIPCYNIYKTKDGKYLTLGALENYFWENFCRAVNHPELIKHQFSPQKIDEVRNILLQRERDEWLSIFRGKDVPCGPLNTIEEAFRDPQILHRKMVVEHEGVKMIGNPIKFSDFSIDIRKAPKLGEHSEEILLQLGYTKEEIKRLKEKKVI
jgi:crotonobetainyl-CoA:carnitine CoA-transferase CaiB-like acyl-CoA transferase